MARRCESSLGAAFGARSDPTKPMTITRSGRVFILRIVARVNATWAWAEDQFGDRWRVLAPSR